MATFKRRQMGVAAGMAGGFTLTAAAFLWPDLPPVPADPQSRVAVWIACIACVATWLLVCVGRLAGHRFFTPDDIDGGGVAGNSPKAALLQALLQNTLEQTVLAIVAYAAWLWLAPPERLGLVIVFTAYFAVGRILFFLGYAHGAPARALGFTLTFYPNVGLFLLCLPEAVGRLASPG
ncbi:MAG TPA: MAPEG family protein [Allosphingosinicella sp.]|jgi:hypothetical protein|nr:MAPEG family protein [Allosphingosinicella sp.]